MLSQAERRDPATFAELIRIIEHSPIANGDVAAQALAVVRDGVITGEGPTTNGRIHFSRTLDADDAQWCARILNAVTMDEQPVSRLEAEALFAIDEAASERTDEGRFDDMFAKAIVHHAAAASGLPVPSRAVALAADTPIESWAPTQAVGVDTEVLEWISSQVRGKRRPNGTLMSVMTMLVGAATLPFAGSVTGLIDFGL